MKYFKLIVWGVIAAVLILLFFQNKGYFLATQAIELNLFVTDTWTSPPLSNGVWLLCALVFGLLVAYFSGLVERFRLRKTVRTLQSAVTDAEARIAALTQEHREAPPAPVSVEASSELPAAAPETTDPA